jgi:DNA-binding transcriptional LysR family regulator
MNRSTRANPSPTSRRMVPASQGNGLRALDLAHLAILGLLLQECSVSRVAELTGKPQPSISRALRRLREVLGDPLLVRSGARMIATERALTLRSPVQEILNQVARIEVDARFAPATAEREFRIAFADCLCASFFPALVSSIASAGPRLRVLMRTIDPAFDVAQALEDGSIDLVVNNSPNPREDLRMGPLYEDEVVCLMRRGHAAARLQRISLARYLNLQHLAPYPSSSKELGPIDGVLAKTGYRRRIVATVPEFNLVPGVLLATDLVFTTGRRFAEHHARQLGMAVVPAPTEFPPMRFYQLWHERNHVSASNAWLRQRVLAAAQPPAS